MSKIEVQGPQGDIQEGQRLIIFELERYNEIRALFRDRDHRDAGTHMLSGQRLESICNYSSCLHGEEGDRDVNMTQGCIQ